MGLQEVGWGMDWIDLAEDRERWRELVSAVMSIKFREFLDRLRTG